MIKYIYEDYLKNQNKDYEFNAIITQPRRIAAINLAKRVQQELSSDEELR